MDKVSSCLHPVKIFSKSLQRYMFVPCGKCSACVVSRGLSRADKLDACLSHFKYVYFFTLTYKDEFLPLAKVVDNSLISNDIDCNGVFYSVSFDDLPPSNIDFVNNCVVKYGGVPVLSHNELIKFKKRFRKNLNKYLQKDEPVNFYLFSVGEYGPQTFRPHFHFVIGFNDDRFVLPTEICREFNTRLAVPKADYGRNSRYDIILGKCICDAWSQRMYDSDTKTHFLRSIGYVDVQRVVGDGVSGYVSTYLNSHSHLPYVLSSTCFRPFSSKSPSVDFNLLRTSCKSVSEAICELPDKITFAKGKDYRLVSSPVWRNHKDRFFPKCPEFNRISHYDRLSLYGTYNLFPSVTATEFAESMFERLISSDFLFVTNFDYVLFLYFRLANRQTAINKLIRLYYVSRKVCINASSLGVSLDYYVRRIEKFYNRLELSKLRSFYENVELQMNDLMNPLSLSDLFSYYYDTDDKIEHYQYYKIQFGAKDLNPSSVSRQIAYASKMDGILLNTTKTKKRNDDFSSRGKVPKIWNPLLSKNKSSLLKKF